MTRDSAGDCCAARARSAAAAGRQAQRLESFQHIEVDRIVDPAVLQSLRAEIERSMRDVRVACADWGKMRAAARQAADDLSSLSARFDAARCERDAGAARLDGKSPLHVPGLPEYRLRGPQGTGCA